MSYCLTLFDPASRTFDPIPPATLAQSRRSARCGVGVTFFVQRWLAGHRMLAKLVADEATRVGLGSNVAAIAGLRTRQEEGLEPLLGACIAEVERAERATQPRSSEQVALELVRRMLAGESAGTAALDYDFDEETWHLSVIGIGSSAKRELASVAAHLGLGVLSVWREQNRLWSWLGARRRLPVAEIERALAREVPDGASFAVGAPGRGLEGWRRSHEQAVAAQLIAGPRPPRLTRCAEVLLETALVSQSSLSALLLERYLGPLDRLRMGGQTARETLRAYLACDGQISSAAHRLGVDRHTISRRLREVEQALGYQLLARRSEIDAALRIEPLIKDQVRPSDFGQDVPRIASRWGRKLGSAG